MQGNFTPSQRDQANFLPNSSTRILQATHVVRSYLFLRNATTTRLCLEEVEEDIASRLPHESFVPLAYSFLVITERINGWNKNVSRFNFFHFFFLFFFTIFPRRETKKRKIARRVIDRDECGEKLGASKFLWFARLNFIPRQVSVLRVARHLVYYFPLWKSGGAALFFFLPSPSFSLDHRPKSLIKRI